MNYRLLKELPDLSVGTIFIPSIKESFYFNQVVNIEHAMRSLPFYLVENRRDWFEEIIDEEIK